MSKMITITFTASQLDIILNGLESMSLRNLNRLMYNEEITEADKDLLSADIDDVRILQGALITQKRLALGTISENAPVMPTNTPSKPDHA